MCRTSVSDARVSADVPTKGGRRGSSLLDLLPVPVEALQRGLVHETDLVRSDAHYGTILAVELEQVRVPGAAKVPIVPPYLATFGESRSRDVPERVDEDEL